MLMKKSSSVNINDNGGVNPELIERAEIDEKNINIMLRLIDLIYFDEDRKVILS